MEAPVMPYIEMFIIIIIVAMWTDLSLAINVFDSLGDAVDPGPDTVPVTSGDVYISQHSMTVPVDGVLVNWRIFIPTADTRLRFQIWRPEGGAVLHQYILVYQVDILDIATPEIMSEIIGQVLEINDTAVINDLELREGDVIGLQCTSMLLRERSCSTTDPTLRAPPTDYIISDLVTFVEHGTCYDVPIQITFTFELCVNPAALVDGNRIEGWTDNKYNGYLVSSCNSGYTLDTAYRQSVKTQCVRSDASDYTGAWEVDSWPGCVEISQYLGCYSISDPTEGFDMTSRYTAHELLTSFMDVVTCSQICAHPIQLTFAALQNGDECYCGYAYGRFSPSDGCTMECEGDASLMCGGADASSVYRILLNPLPTYSVGYDTSSAFSHTMAPGEVMLFLKLKFEYNGFLSSWDVYCRAGTAHLSVWRPVDNTLSSSDPQQYQFIGENSVHVDTSQQQTLDVSPNDQIQVSIGDVVGVFSARGISQCMTTEPISTIYGGSPVQRAVSTYYDDLVPGSVVSFTSGTVQTVPLKAHLTINNSTESFEQYGCYDLDVLAPIEPQVFSTSSGAPLSMYNCARKCHEQLYQYAGLSNGDSCGCSSTFNESYEVKYGCGLQCPPYDGSVHSDNSLDNCGGINLTSVVKLSDVKVCDPLEVSHGTVLPISSNSTAVNIQHNVTCDSGYVTVNTQDDSYSTSSTVSCEMSLTHDNDVGDIMVEWNPNGICYVLNCSAPYSLDTDVYLEAYTSTAIGDIITYHCDRGFVFDDAGENVGDSVVTRVSSCNLVPGDGGTEGAEWSEVNDRCTRLDCGAPLAIDHATILTTSSTEFGGSTTYTCVDHYESTADLTTVCMVDHSDLTTPYWTAISASCLLHNCGPPPSPSANMTYTFTTTQYLSVTTYTCELGYHYVTELSWRDGDDDLTRRSVCDDVWSVVDDQCQLIPCDHAPLVDHAHTPPGISYYGDIQRYTCNIGYEFAGDGADEIVCTVLASNPTEAVWTELSVVCQPIDCGTPVTLDDHATLSVTTTTYLSAITHFCEPGYFYNTTYSFTIIDNNVTRHSICDIDVGGDGDNAIVWTSMLDTCIAVDCGTPPAIPFSYVDYQSTTHNATAVYSCNRGYVFNDDYRLTESSVCVADPDDNTRGIWTSGVPSCEMADCGSSLPDVTNAVVRPYTHTKFSSCLIFDCQGDTYLYDTRTIVTYRCNQAAKWKVLGWGYRDPPACGYEIRQTELDSSTPTLSCWIDGETSNVTMPNTVPPTTEPTLPDATTTSTDGTTVENDVVIIIPPLPLYNYYACPFPPLIPNSMIDAPPGLQNLDIVIYYCTVGFMFEDGTTARVLTCIQGEWEMALGGCMASQCPFSFPPPDTQVDVPTLSHYDYGTVLTLTCEDAELNLITGELIHRTECSINQEWSQLDGECREDACFTPPYVEHASMVFVDFAIIGHDLILTCDLGYRFRDGTQMKVISCDESKHWDLDPEDICEVTRCPSLLPPAFGTIETNIAVFDTLVAVQCFTGYKFPDDNTSITVKCLDTAQWSDSFTDCIEITCPPPIQYLAATLSSSGTTFNSTAIYTCDVSADLTSDLRFWDGFTVKVITCMAPGVWDMEASDCTDTRCPPVPVLGNATPLSLQATVGSVIYYQCDDGFMFEQQDQIVIQCVQKNWNVTDAACEAIHCPHINNTHSDLLQYGTEYGSQVTVICHQGFYYETGILEFTIECQSNATWNASYNCKPVECGPSPDVPQSHYTPQMGFYNDVAHYTCIQGYQFNFTIPHTTEIDIRCNEEAEWEPKPSPCQLVTCPPIQTWESMLSNTSVYVYNTYVNVSCEEGLVLDTWQDWSIVWCDENRAWIPTPPQCTDDSPSSSSNEPEEAPQSQYIGIVAVAVMCVPLCLALTMDVFIIYSTIPKCCNI